MSREMVQRWKLVQTASTHRFVGWVLADAHNAETGQCNPSVLRLCRLTGFSDRTVAHAIQALENEGHLTVRRKSGGRSEYILHPQATFEEEELMEEETPEESSPPPPKELRPRRTFAPEGASPPPPKELRGTPEGASGNRERREMEREHPLLPALGKPAGEEASGGKDVQPKPAAPSKASDPRHHGITSRIGDRHQAATGQPLPLTGRDVKALQTFLKSWRGTAEEFLATAEKAWIRGRRDPFARNCLEGSSLAGLCSRWPQIQSELARKPGNAGSKPAAPVSSSPDLARFGIRRGAV